MAQWLNGVAPKITNLISDNGKDLVVVQSEFIIYKCSETLKMVFIDLFMCINNISYHGICLTTEIFKSTMINHYNI